MNMIRYEPWSFLNHLQGEMNWLFGNHLQNKDDNGSAVETSQWLPPVDIKEEDHRFVLYADVPGVKPEDIEITMENHILTIRGERFIETSEQKNNYARIERVKGLFYRRFTLPDSADGERIIARCNQGVLEVEISKKEQSKPRKITVQATKEKS